MERTLWFLGLTLLLGLAEADLDGYIHQPDPHFQWVKSVEDKIGTSSFVELTLISQKWREFEWKHRLRVVKPTELRHTELAVLFITGSGGGRDELQLAATLAEKISAVVAVLHDIPNQPLFRPDLVEDNLIAHTFMQYLETNDETWPLLLPMVKGTVRAMDAVQAFTRQEWNLEVKGFLVTGGSKRGWTTWLTAAADKRVKAIAPMVFDMLNFFAQVPHQLATWGKYSEQISEYSSRSLMDKMNTPRGRQLVSMVDPYFYRARYTMPILIINGANDRYWVIDAARWYFNELPSKEKHLLYVPNSGHGLEDRTRVLNSLVAFYLNRVGELRFPSRLEGQLHEGGEVVVLELRSDLKPKKVLVWTARSESRDFRDSKWEPMEVEGSQKGNRWIVQIERPQKGSLALFAEAHYQEGGHEFTLCTLPQVVGPSLPAGSSGK